MIHGNVQLSSAQPPAAASTHDTTRAGVASRLTSPTSVPILAACLGLLLALASGAIAASRAFDGLYGQDAYAYFDYATGSVRQSILHLSPLEPFFWPPGYPLLVAIASVVLGPYPLAGQLVSLLMGALVPVLTVLLARALWPDDIALALLAGALVAVCGQLWQSSVVVMADTTGLALATFSAFALVRYAREPAVGWLVAASAAIALATLARWIYGLVAVPLAFYALSVLLDSNNRSRTGLWHAAVATGVAGVILGPLLVQPLLGLLRDPGQPAAFAGNFQVYSWSPLNALRRDFFTADGHLVYTQPNGLYYVMAAANPAYFGPWLAVWILPGLWAARRWPIRNVLLVVGWAAIVFVFHAGAPWQNFRFTLAYLPPLAILASAGILLVWRWLATVRPSLRALVTVCVLAGLVTTSGASVRLVERFVDSKDHDLTLVHWVQSQAPANAELFSFGPTLAFRHYSGLPTFDLFDVSAADIHAILADPAPHYLLIDTSSVEGQWLGQAPSSNFHVLRDEVGLDELGSSEGYTLYQIAR
jgi:4-amino-4-deoxy-L-arabinose transferase-like glycosyltransferase